MPLTQAHHTGLQRRLRLQRLRLTAEARITEEAPPSAKLRRVEFVGPQAGKELAENGSLALLLAVFGIAIYLAMRFEWPPRFL